MARQTKMKIAAFATALVATVGMAAVSPAASADHSGKKVTITQMRGEIGTCC